MATNHSDNQPSLYGDEIRQTAPPNAVKSQNDENAIQGMALLGLADIPGIGFVTLKRLYQQLSGDLHKVWALDEPALQELFAATRVQNREALIKSIVREGRKYQSYGVDAYQDLIDRRIDILFPSDQRYPEMLRDLEDAPSWLFVQGDVGALNATPNVAVVGTRTPTVEGIKSARYLSISIIRAGLTVLSGLAEGIDEVCHQTVVDLGGLTVAVLGHGIDVTFPAKTAGLRRQIVEIGGCVITEYLPGDMYSREKFVQRNRIQAALSSAVAIVEGRSKSGTAHTFRFARKLNRRVLGVHFSAEGSSQNLELLGDIHNQGFPVVNLSNGDDVIFLREFLLELQTNWDRIQDSSDIYVFHAVENEIERIIRDYGVEPSDLSRLARYLDALMGGER